MHPSLLYTGKGHRYGTRADKKRKRLRIQSKPPYASSCLTHRIIKKTYASHPSPLVIDMPCLFTLEKLMCQAIATLCGLAECNLCFCYFHSVDKVDDHAVKEV